MSLSPGSDCPFAAELPAWAHGELVGAEAVRVEAHLRSCRACQHELEQLERLLGELGDLVPAFEDPLDRPPSDLARRVTEIAEATRLGPPVREATFRALLGMLGALLLILGVVTLREEPGRLPPPEVPPLEADELARAEAGALRWLLAQQASDGSFGAGEGPRLSVASRTAFVIHALTPRVAADAAASPARDGLSAAVAFLLSRQEEGGGFGMTGYEEEAFVIGALARVQDRFGGPTSLGQAVVRAEAALAARPRGGRLGLDRVYAALRQGAALPEDDVSAMPRSLIMELMVGNAADPAMARAQALLARRLLSGPELGVYQHWLPRLLRGESTVAVALALLALEKA